MPSLSSLSAIADHLKKSPKTTLKLIKENNLPAAKIRGEWVSDTDLINRWRVLLIEGTMQGVGK